MQHGSGIADQVTLGLVAQDGLTFGGDEAELIGQDQIEREIRDIQIACCDQIGRATCGNRRCRTEEPQRIGVDRRNSRDVQGVELTCTEPIDIEGHIREFVGGQVASQGQIIARAL